MKTITKREELWRDRHSMEELLESKLFQALHELYASIIMINPPLFPINELTLMNEVGYSVAWLQYQSTRSKQVDVEQMLRNAYVTMGVKHYVEIVVCFTWAAVKLVEYPLVYISKNAEKELKRMVGQCWCGTYAIAFVKKLCREGVYFTDSFEEGVTWETIEPRAACDISGEEVRALMAAEDEVQYTPGQDRTFTLAQIVEEAKASFPLTHSYALVFMLQRMMQHDSTAEERSLVDGIIDGIIQRDMGKPHADQIIIHNEGTVNHY